MERKAQKKSVAPGSVSTVAQARAIADRVTAGWSCRKLFAYGLPEFDDRNGSWRVPLVAVLNPSTEVGAVVIDANTTLPLSSKTTSEELVAARVLAAVPKEPRAVSGPIVIPSVRSTLAAGDSEEVLKDMSAESIGLCFTSPPYFNARPDYSEYEDYNEYLEKLGRIFKQVHRTLLEGRFLVVNTAPVLLRRSSRSQASKRLAVPYDLHSVITKLGFDFVDDIIWVKPEGAGWATGRGRRFAADRNPLAYKAVPVTEHVMVYRKSSDQLIDWNIRNHPDQEAVKRSRIEDGYEKTNLWKLTPAHSKKHPAIFPESLAERIIRYYSFEGDMVLDPFAGSGTVGAVAARLSRRWTLVELNQDYVDLIRHAIPSWQNLDGDEVNYVNCDPPMQLKLL